MDMITKHYKMKLNPDVPKTISLTIEREVLETGSDDEIINQLSAFIFDYLKCTNTHLVYLWVNNGCERDDYYIKLRDFIIDTNEGWIFDASKDPDTGDVNIVLKKHQQAIIIEQINN
jgi:hypothetical protein